MVYVHGKGGRALEAERLKPLFPEHDVFGFDYRAQTPWDAAEEFPQYFGPLCARYASVTLAANSLGAYFSLCALGGLRVAKACLISPVLDMGQLILGMLKASGATEAELEARRELPTAFGETLSWDYLCYVRAHPVGWNIPTEILYGENDELTPFKTVNAFARRVGAGVTVMPGGEHWFHTEAQLAFLDAWLRRTVDR